MRVVVRLVWFCIFVFVFSLPVRSSGILTASSGSQSQDTLRLERNESLFGMVVQVNYLREANPHDPIVEIRMQQRDKTVTVRLGPSSFLNAYGFTLKEGEDVAIRVRRDASAGNDKGVFVGMEISKGTRKLTLRDDQGQPLW
jgi:hypothetical protein